ncbi:hybrid sensor histidine kinase/response regulator [Ramlibacter sp.]|uniref:hybrid sensor histidine kinase/response regulator n=1 Tax=Ramlibacter sp. TaxID=1917967 RepID=UPI002D4593A7|nr:ATP-binding protein [Ramlibacter sp.]HYD75845.1 ATP-binding protein [Ramlibacter sp.]
MSAGPGSGELRVLLRAVTGKDASMSVRLLERAGIEALPCTGPRHLLQQIAGGAGALMVAEEALGEPGFEQVIVALRSQPAWSDLPAIVLARPGADSPAIARAMSELANITVLERPVRVAALVSVVRSALAARKRQYQLRAMLDGLREADLRKTEFLATLAHELRNPLAPLRNGLAILNRQEVERTRAMELYGMMERQVGHMVRLIDDLLEVSRITRGKLQLRLEPVDVVQVLRDAADVSRPLVEENGLELVLDLPQEPWPAMGDKVRLVQVFSNLLNNAARYSVRQGRIEVEMKREDGTGRVSIRDGGIGIAPADLPRIFDMFVQVSDASRAPRAGLGIGLTLVRTLVDLHQGEVSAHSEGLGHGSTFTVRLPLLPATEPVGPAPAQTPAVSGQQVLVVDDNRDAADSLASLLEMLGCTPQTAYSGAEALRLAVTTKPAIAILDIGMPDMDGCELARRIRSLPGTAGIYLVALTGWGQEPDRARVSAAGFDQHLLKPVAVEDLVRTLSAAVPAPQR